MLEIPIGIIVLALICMAFMLGLCMVLMAKLSNSRFSERMYERSEEQYRKLAEDHRRLNDEYGWFRLFVQTHNPDSYTNFMAMENSKKGKVNTGGE